LGLKGPGVPEVVEEVLHIASGDDISESEGEGCCRQGAAEGYVQLIGDALEGRGQSLALLFGLLRGKIRESTVQRAVCP
jgi:hypothetical protein